MCCPVALWWQWRIANFISSLGGIVIIFLIFNLPSRLYTNHFFFPFPFFLLFLQQEVSFGAYKVYIPVHTYPALWQMNPSKKELGNIVWWFAPILCVTLPSDPTKIIVPATLTFFRVLVFFQGHLLCFMHSIESVQPRNLQRRVLAQNMCIYEKLTMGACTTRKSAWRQVGSHPFI